MRHIHADHMIAAANDISIEWQRLSYDNWANIGKSGQFTFYPESQYRQRPASHPHQAMIDQAKADPLIKWQLLSSDGVNWHDCSPSWIGTMQYRQKPAEPKMVDMWLWAITSDCGDIYTSDLFHSTKEDAQDYNTKNIICRIEGSKITVPEVSQ
jgi:hypothetical protein